MDSVLSNQIALIRKNTLTFDQMTEYVVPLLYRKLGDEKKELRDKLNDYIWSIIGEFVIFATVDEYSFMDCVADHILKGLQNHSYDEIFFHVDRTFSTPKKALEFCYGTSLQSTYVKNKEENLNDYGCLLSIPHHIIENSCVLYGLNYDLNSDTLVKLSTVDKMDLIRIIKRRYFFSAILLKKVLDEKTNKYSDVTEKYYYQNPQVLVNEVFQLTEENPTIEKLKVSIFKYNLVFYFKQDKTNYVNDIATRINGAYIIRGDVLILHEMEENIYTNISLRELKRINVLSYGRLYDREIKPDEDVECNDIAVPADLPPNTNEEDVKNHIQARQMWTKYIVVEKRMMKRKSQGDVCSFCYKKIIKPVVCQRCFRARYCSVECETDNKSPHYDDCIHPDYK